MVTEMTTRSTYDLAWITKLSPTALASLELNVSTNTEFVRPIQYLLDLLIADQHSDGSWGSKAFSFSDRLLNTLAAVVALAFNCKRWPELTFTRFPATFQRSLQKGLDWLNTKTQKQTELLEQDRADLAGFELLVPALIAELSAYGLSFMAVNSSTLLAKARAKLSRVDAKFIYQSGSPLSHALEFTGTLLTPTVSQVSEAISPNGSVGNSPAATAFALSFAWNELSENQRNRALAYLNQAAIRREENGEVIGWPVTYPVTQFVSIWHEYYHHLIRPSQALEQTFTKSLAAKIATLTSKGFGADVGFAVDCDTTATYLVLMTDYLAELGEFGQLRALLETLVSFFNFDKGYFTTYPAEMTASVTTNAHAWQALQLILKFLETNQENREWLPVYETTLLLMAEQTGNFIYSKVVGDDIYFKDKWHISTSYATLHVIASGLLNNEREWLSKILTDLLGKQGSDGGWSFDTAKSNLDETLHYLILVKLLSRKLELGSNAPTVNKAVTRAVAFLAQEKTIEAMWCDKVLYAPVGLLSDLITLFTESYTELDSQVTEQVA